MTAILLWAMFPTQIDNAPQELPDQAVVLRMLKDREAAIRNYSFRLKATKVMLPNMDRKNEYVTLRRVHFVTFDQLGRFFVDAAGDGIGGGERPQAVPHIEKNVFDGKAFKAIYGRSRFDWGRIEKWSHATALLSDARPLIGHFFFGRPVSAILERNGFQCLGRKSFNGRDCLWISTVVDEARAQKNMAGRFTFLIDDERGGLVVRSALERVRAPDSESFEVQFFEIVESIEATPGVWVASRAIGEMCAGQTRAELFSAHRVASEADQWAINVDLPESFFTLEFPEGCNVLDKISGRSFVAAKISDKAIERARRDFEKLERAEREMRSDADVADLRPQLLRPGMSTRGLWLTAAGVAVGLAVAAAVVYVWRRRSRSR